MHAVIFCTARLDARCQICLASSYFNKWSGLLVWRSVLPTCYCTVLLLALCAAVESGTVFGEASLILL